MELSVAKTLIEQGVIQSGVPQVWADFGAGDGLFARALSELLPAKSKIVAVDQNERALKNISGNADIEIQTVVADLNNISGNFQLFDGIIMANALHYIKSQASFLRKLKTELLKQSGVLIVIEYNLEKPNPWVPYPISKRRLVSLSSEAGFELQLSNSVQSKLNSSEIYSALLKPKV